MHSNSLVRSLTVLLALASVSLRASGSQQPWPEDPSLAPNPHFPQELHGGVLPSILVAGISPNVRTGIYYTSGGNSITRRLSEHDAQSVNDWYTTETQESVTWTITSVAAREGGREVYVAGVKFNGDHVIRKFLYGVRPGGYFIAPSSTEVAALGEPQPEFQAVEALKGASWSSPPSVGRAGVREPVWSGTGTGVIAGLVADPEGRYLLALGYPSGTVFMIDLAQSSPSPVPILTAADQPQLAGRQNLALFRHETEGRKAVITLSVDNLVDPNWIVLNDADNDGVFESHSIKTHAAIGSSLSRYWNTGVEFNWDE